MRPDDRPLPSPRPHVEAGCGAVLIRLPCGAAVTIDPDSARRTGQALIDAGRCSLPRRNPGNIPDKRQQLGSTPRWIILPIAFLVAAGLLVIPSLMFADASNGLMVAAIVLAVIITAPIARSILRQGHTARTRSPAPPQRRVLSLVAGRDVGPDNIRTVTQLIGNPERRS